MATPGRNRFLYLVVSLVVANLGMMIIPSAAHSETGETREKQVCAYLGDPNPTCETCEHVDHMCWKCDGECPTI